MLVSIIPFFFFFFFNSIRPLLLMLMTDIASGQVSGGEQPILLHIMRRNRAYTKKKVELQQLPSAKTCLHKDSTIAALLELGTPKPKIGPMVGVSESKGRKVCDRILAQRQLVTRACAIAKRCRPPQRTSGGAPQPLHRRASLVLLRLIQRDGQRDHATTMALVQQILEEEASKNGCRAEPNGTRRVARISRYDANQLVFLDESAANERTADRKYGWAPRDARAAE